MNAPWSSQAFEEAAHDAQVGDIPPPSRMPRHRSLRSTRRRRRGQRDADKTMHTHSTDRWMISYADFITLLFAFFVVMYATSSINEGRYRLLSGALSTAFGPDDPSVLARTPPTVPNKPEAERSLPATAKVSVPEAKAVPIDPVDPQDRAEIEKNAERSEHMKQLATRVDEHLQSLVQDGSVQVTRGARGIAIEINAAVLFDPAKADLKPASFEPLRALANVLSKFVEPLQIEGHSDDVPIATREFKSNWELSAARAASVGRFLIDQGITPNRIGIAGYAAYRPLVANTDPATRARNRRVTLVILSADDTRPQEGPASPDQPMH